MRSPRAFTSFLVIVGFAAAFAEESEMTLLQRLDHHQNLLLKLQADLATMKAENAALRSVVGSNTDGPQSAFASQPGSSDQAPSHRRKLTTSSSTTGSILWDAGKFVIAGGDITSTSRFIGGAGSLINMAFAQDGYAGFGGTSTANGVIQINAGATWNQGGHVISYSPIYSDASTTVIVQCGMGYIITGGGTDNFLFKISVYDSDTSATSEGWEQPAYYTDSGGGGGRGMPHSFITEFSGWTGDTISAQIILYNSGLADDVVYIQNTQCTFIERAA